MHYKTIKYEEFNLWAKITLNRPEVRNAINSEMVNELYELFSKLSENDNIRAIMITGAGNSFCAGADMNWLKSIADYSYDENYLESLNLVNLLYSIHNHPKPIIAKVNGSAVGGGVGLMLVSDIIIASENSKFGLSEVAIGIVPVAIAPFVMTRIGETKAREYFLTGERLDAKSAEQIGLINYSVPDNLIDDFAMKKINIILNNGPEAITNIKKLVNRINKKDYDKDYLAQLIAQLRISEEGQEGMHAFLEKREPNWTKNRNEN